ncbi:A24 family peptidase [Amphritea balenae]|uniref:Prepilin peptidase n=1 Tax=Amphritea balenae TaxID=452629 RepID=A0A3P1SXB1_9GAMM|nr:A24 family peptidase [Amphritea balenae]RRD01176.1 prepilin peptidase [Amphritea balenae]GGK59312.1 pilus assembly-related outer membrane protein [Amphritea balenae]
MVHTLITELLLTLTLLLMAVVILIDMKWHKIPNFICLSFLSIGLAVQLINDGLIGLIYGTAGVACGFLLFLPFYILKGMAAGDVKMLASLGAILGPQETFFAAMFTLIIGGILALVILLYKALFHVGFRKTLDILHSYLDSIQIFIATKTIVRPNHQAQELTNTRFPYALAISAGSFTALSQHSIFSFIHIKALLASQLALTGGLL